MVSMRRFQFMVLVNEFQQRKEITFIVIIKYRNRSKNFYCKQILNREAFQSNEKTECSFSGLITSTCFILQCYRRLLLTLVFYECTEVLYLSINKPSTKPTLINVNCVNYKYRLMLISSRKCNENFSPLPAVLCSLYNTRQLWFR